MGASGPLWGLGVEASEREGRDPPRRRDGSARRATDRSGPIRGGRRLVARPLRRAKFRRRPSCLWFKGPLIVVGGPPSSLRRSGISDDSRGRQGTGLGGDEEAEEKEPAGGGSRLRPKAETFRIPPPILVGAGGGTPAAGDGEPRRGTAHADPARGAVRGRYSYDGSKPKCVLVHRTHTLQDVVPPLDLADPSKDTSDGRTLVDVFLLSHEFRFRHQRKVAPLKALEMF